MWLSREEKKVVYDKIAEEIMRKDYDRSLMAEAIAQSNGSDSKARSRYIKMRIKQVRQTHPHTGKFRAQSTAMWGGMAAIGLFVFLRNQGVAPFDYQPSDFARNALILAGAAFLICCYGYGKYVERRRHDNEAPYPITKSDNEDID